MKQVMEFKCEQCSVTYWLFRREYGSSYSTKCRFCPKCLWERKFEQPIDKAARKRKMKLAVKRMAKSPSREAKLRALLAWRKKHRMKYPRRPVVGLPLE